MKKLCALLLFCFLAITSGHSEILPLTPGESLIPQGKQWKKTGVSGKLGESSRFASSANLYFYSGNTGDKAAATLSRDFDNLKVGEFDQLVCWLTNHGKAIFATLEVTTDKGVVIAKSGKINSDFHASFTDMAVDLKGAKIIKKIKLKCVFAEKDTGGTSVSVKQLIFRNKSEFAAYMNYWRRFDRIKWDGLIKDRSYNPKYKLRYGFLFNQHDLDQWRKKNSRICSKESWPSPEKAIVPNFGRPRSHFDRRMIASGANPVKAGNVALRALILKDKELMHLAARYLLSLCTIPEWGEDSYPKTIGSGVITAFNNGNAGFNAAFAADCVWEMLTKKGQQYVLKMLMYKAFMPITYSEWSRPLCFKSNQGPSFMRGKLAALLIAERNWQRVTAYTDLAKAELDEAVSFLFKADGSYMEASPAYLRYTIKCMKDPYQAFASMRKKPLSEVVPANVSKSGDIAQIISSSCRNPRRMIVTFGQNYRMDGFGAMRIAFMALACPDSMWVNLFNKLDKNTILRHCQSTYMGDGIVFSKYYKAIKKLKNTRPKALVLLKQCGLVSSYRKSADNKITKIVFIGDALDTGKKHNDAGSFILEYAGDIYALDMPVYAGFLSTAQYHNMLVALDKNGKFTNSISYIDPRIRHNAKARNSMIPKASGDAGRFHVTADLSKSQEKKYFKKWVRTLASPNPDELIITDEYKLGGNAGGAAFIWNTYLPCKVTGQKVTVSGEYGSKCEITAPEDCKINLEKFSPGTNILKGMALPLTHKCTRIIIRISGSANEENKMEVKVRLIP